MSERTALEVAAILEDSMPICGRAAVIALRRQHAAIERLTALNSALTEKTNALVIANARLDEEIGQLAVEKFRRFNGAECWIYQQNGENHLDRLKCPVVISPEELLSMQAELKCLTAERNAAAASAALSERTAIAAQLREWADELGFEGAWRWKTPGGLLYRAAEMVGDRTKP